MANRLSEQGEFTIPSLLIAEHEWISDFLIDDQGKKCRLIYPQSLNPCPNCKIDPKTGMSTGIYKVGGPISFSNHTTCPWCYGRGRKSIPNEESINLRVFFDPKTWANIGIRIENTNDTIQIIGYMSDLPKIERAQELVVDVQIRGIKEWRCQPHSEAIPWGFKQNRYFVQFWKRTGGS